MAYTKTEWVDYPSETTPINATNLNHIEQGIYDNDQAFLTNGLNVSNEVDEDYRVNLIEGNNLFKGSLFIGIINEGGDYSGVNNRITNANSTTMKTFILKKGTYTVDVPGLDYCAIITKNESGTRVDDFADSWRALPFTFTTTQDAYIYISARKSDNSVLNPNDYSFILQEGSTIEPIQYNQIVVDNEKYTDTLNVGTSVDSRSRVNVLKSKNLFDLDYYFNNVPANNCTKEKTTTGIKLNFTAGADAFVGWAGKSGQTVTDVTKSYLIKVKPSTTYTIALSTGTRNSSYITYISNDFNVINSNYVPLNSIFNYTFTTASNCYYIALRFGVSDNSITTYTFADIRLNEGSTALPYEPYIVPSIYVDNEEIYSKDNIEQYSTSEIRIGTWVDGKPLYRKVFTITNLTSSNTNLVDVSGLSIDFAKISGTIITSTGAKFPINLYDSASNYSVIIISDSGYIRGRGAIGSGTLSKCIIILEYTKTTD